MNDLEIISRVQAAAESGDPDPQAAAAYAARVRAEMLFKVPPRLGVEEPLPVGVQVAAEINRRRARNRARTSRADGAR